MALAFDNNLKGAFPLEKIYCPYVKEEIDRVLDVFRDFIDSTPGIDVVWSDKAGYILLDIVEHKGRILVGETCCVRIEDAPQLVKHLISEIAYATVQEMDSESSMDELSEQECEKVVQRLRPYIARLPAYEHLVLAAFMREKRHYSL